MVGWFESEWESDVQYGSRRISEPERCVVGEWAGRWLLRVQGLQRTTVDCEVDLTMIACLIGAGWAWEPTKGFQPGNTETRMIDSRRRYQTQINCRKICGFEATKKAEHQASGCYAAP
ncbi:hypothetical protein GOODEAATRI_021464 [Goodea atripinnis]|uniref:Uncharacterized protein n=1 Tax=Goodea atripinnis TaxID=208336 RepID=A0ABV0N4P0_9TELE